MVWTHRSNTILKSIDHFRGRIKWKIFPLSTLDFCVYVLYWKHTAHILRFFFLGVWYLFINCRIFVILVEVLFCSRYWISHSIVSIHYSLFFIISHPRLFNIYQILCRNLRCQRWSMWRRERSPTLCSLRMNRLLMFHLRDRSSMRVKPTTRLCRRPHRSHRTPLILARRRIILRISLIIKWFFKFRNFTHWQINIDLFLLLLLLQVLLLLYFNFLHRTFLLLRSRPHILLLLLHERRRIIKRLGFVQLWNILLFRTSLSYQTRSLIWRLDRVRTERIRCFISNQNSHVLLNLSINGLSHQWLLPILLLLLIVLLLLLRWWNCSKRWKEIRIILPSSCTLYAVTSIIMRLHASAECGLFHRCRGVFSWERGRGRRLVQRHEIRGHVPSCVELWRSVEWLGERGLREVGSGWCGSF